MSSEWMKVMLEEIARKNAERIQEEAERELRRGEPEASPAQAPVPSGTAPGGRTRR